MITQLTKDMKKNCYVAPQVEVHEIDVECMLDMSATGSLPGTGIGGESNGSMDADANIRNEWDEGLW